ncbi:uncharacterized protein LOC113874189 [Abrus precatorius]|uniref:Uncharacterized protein LOC113874189 n=1 Tax=Abrus precatorius TaxID=3816 RepID=A0A8B8MLU7_ABRPR|nr:uncharacterized protein LOC113874189 [Abrus precatorius]
MRGLYLLVPPARSSSPGSLVFNPSYMLAQLEPPSYSASSSDSASSTTDAENASSLPTKAAKLKNRNCNRNRNFCSLPYCGFSNEFRTFSVPIVSLIASTADSPTLAYPDSPTDSKTEIDSATDSETYSVDAATADSDSSSSASSGERETRRAYLWHRAFFLQRILAAIDRPALPAASSSADSLSSSSVSSADSVDPDSPGVDSAISSAYLTSNSATETDDGTESGTDDGTDSATDSIGTLPDPDEGTNRLVDPFIPASARF